MIIKKVLMFHVKHNKKNKTKELNVPRETLPKTVEIKNIITDDVPRETQYYGI